MSIERPYSLIEPIPIIHTSFAAPRLAAITIEQAVLRKRILERTALEVFEKSFFNHRALFDSWDAFLNTIKKSISGNYLTSLCVYGTHKNKFVFSLELTIDWENHRLLATSIDFSKINPNLSIAEQVDAAIPQIIDFIKDKAQTYNIDGVVPVYSFTSADKITSQKRDLEAGVCSIPESFSQKRNQFINESIGHEVRPARLKEMTIAYRFRAKP